MQHEPKIIDSPTDSDIRRAPVGSVCFTDGGRKWRLQPGGAWRLVGKTGGIRRNVEGASGYDLTRGTGTAAIVELRIPPQPMTLGDMLTMDDADFDACVDELRTKRKGQPAPRG